MTSVGPKYWSFQGSRDSATPSVFAAALKSEAVGAPFEPGLRIRSPLPPLMRSRLACILAHSPGPVLPSSTSLGFLPARFMLTAIAACCAALAASSTTPTGDNTFQPGSALHSVSPLVPGIGCPFSERNSIYSPSMSVITTRNGGYPPFNGTYSTF